MKVHTGSFNTGTGAVASTVTVSGLPFEPQALILWWSGETSTTDAAGSGHEQRGFGLVASATQRACVFSRSEDAVAAADTSRAGRLDACVGVFVSATDTIDGLLDFDTFLSDGFRFVVDDQFAASYRIHYKAIRIADDEADWDAFVGQINEPGAAGNQSTTGPGFQPTFAAFISAYTSALSGDQHLSFGAASGTGANDQFVWASAHDDSADPALGRTYCRAGEVLARVDLLTDATITRASLNSFDTNGLTLNFAERNSTIPIYFLALRGGNYKVGNTLSQTDGSNEPVTGAGFAPASVMMVSGNRAADAADDPSTSVAWSMGAGTSAADQRCMATFDEAGAATMEVCRSVSHDSIYQRFGTADALVGEAELVTLDSDGFTFAHSDPDPDQAFIGYILFGPAEGGQDIDVGLISETDSAQAVTWTKSKAVGLNTETDSVLALTRTKARTVGLNTETDSAFAVTYTRARTAGLNEETDTALAATAQRSYPVGLNTETDSALAIAHSKSRVLGLALEVDESLQVSSGDSVVAGLAEETDQAFGVSAIKVKAVGLNETTDSVLALTRLKTRALGLNLEVDEPLAMTHSRQLQLGLTQEQAEAFAVTFFKSLGLGLAIELDEALPIEQPDRPLDPSAYIAVPIEGQSPPLFTIEPGAGHAKLFNV